MAIFKNHLLGVLSLAVCLGPVYASDHVDAPTLSEDSASDINDLYAWTDNESMLNLVMTIGGLEGLAQFSDSTQYVFHLKRTSEDEVYSILCEFNEDQRFFCWGGNQYVQGEVNTETGHVSENGKMKAFAGTRADPFFMSDGLFDLLKKLRIVRIPVLL